MSHNMRLPTTKKDRPKLRYNSVPNVLFEIIPQTTNNDCIVLSNKKYGKNIFGSMFRHKEQVI